MDRQSNKSEIRGARLISQGGHETVCLPAVSGRHRLACQFKLKQHIQEMIDMKHSGFREQQRTDLRLQMATGNSGAINLLQS